MYAMQREREWGERKLKVEVKRSVLPATSCGIIHKRWLVSRLKTENEL
jgi:hypothetical protein